MNDEEIYMDDSYQDSYDKVEHDLEEQYEDDIEQGTDIMSVSLDMNDEDTVADDNADADGGIEEIDEDKEIDTFQIGGSADSYVMTRSEYDNLQKEKESKEADLKIANENVNETRKAGDLSENEAFQHWKEVADGLRIDLKRINEKILNAHIVDESDDGRIGLGSRVHIIAFSVNTNEQVIDSVCKVVSEGFGGIDEKTQEVMMPVNSEVYRNMVGLTHGEFVLTGTDGCNYRYNFNKV